MSNNTSLPQNDSTPLVHTSDLISQTSHGPTLDQVASQLLRRALKELYPQLEIDPDAAVVASPQWRVVDDSVEAGPTLFESLTHALVRQGLQGTKANFLEGEHYLTLEPDSKSPVHLAVSIEEIAKLLNESASMLFVALQGSQLDFWNARGHRIARWQELSDTLRQALNVQKVKGWDGDECAMAREVFNDPDNTTRKNTDSGFSVIQACLIDIDTVEDDATHHLLIGGALVLKATYNNRPLLVMYTIERAYESFSSMTQLGDSLPARLQEQLKGRTLTWRLYEPQGNIFDHMAWALVSSQLDAIHSLNSIEARLNNDVEPETGLDPAEKARFLQLDAAIPDWLHNASPQHISDYSRYINGLGMLYRQPQGKLARAEVPSITDFAQRLMREAIIADPLAVGATHLALDDLRIKITNSFTADNLTLPNPLDQRIETLAEYAMENEAPFMASVFFKSGAAVPGWLTPQWLTLVAARVDVGKAYPLLIKLRLQENPLSSQRQEDFYRNQLRWLLPLQALEARYQAQTGVDEQGYRYICELLDPDLTNKTVALYPLTMTPQHRLISTSDTVENMFIIGPRATQGGPCLLYRPMLDEPLLQFPSRQNLLYAMHQAGELRDSVLAWLPDKALSFEYAQYVFPTGLPSPWLVAEQVVNPLQRADRFGRVVLESDEITGDVLSVLFKSNAQALVDLADRQAQSNAEYRWRVLNDSAWALLNVASNFLSGAVGAAVWVWQAIDQIQQALDARDRGDEFIEWTSVADVLLALGMILSHHAAMARKRPSSTPGIERLPLDRASRPDVRPVTATFNPVALAPEHAPSHYASLDVAGSVPRRTPTALGAYLDTFKVVAPDLSSEQVTTVRPAPPHIYQHDNRNYAQVGERWFYVNVSGEQQIQIVHPDAPARTGPLLLDSGKGQWVLDLRLRLRGGGGNALSRLQATVDFERLDKALKAFKHLEPVKEAELKKRYADAQQASAQDYDRLMAVYVEKLDTAIDEYRQALGQLRQWRELGGSENYQQELLRMSGALQKNLSLWLVIKRVAYGKAISVMTDPGHAEPVPRQTYVEQIQLATDIGQEMEQKLTLWSSTLEGMRAAGKAGVESARLCSKVAPSFSALDLKANEIGMAQELCLQEQASPLMQQARVAVGRLVVSAATAAIKVIELTKAGEAPARLEGRIEELSRLMEVFADAEQRIRELPDVYPGLVKPPRLNHLRTLIDEFAQLAHNRLQALLPEPEPLARPGPVDREHPGPSRPAIKVRRTRPRDPVRNQAQSSSEEPLQPLTPAIYQQPATALGDLDIIEAGTELNLDAEKFMERTRKDAFLPRRIPADIQDLFDQQALKLEQSANSVDQALANISKAKGTPPPAANLGLELREAARRLRQEGIKVRASLYGRRKPTQSIFKWMHENGQIDISRDPRGRIRTRGLGDFFQEYRIVDKTRNQPLWVAHFHYETLKSPASTPTAAHLKVSEDYLKTLTPELQKDLSTLEPIDGVFRKIEEPLLRKLFLDLEPETVTTAT
jgi:hypothetical protein